MWHIGMNVMDFENPNISPFSKLGEETAKILAVNYREEQIARLILEGVNYTERHGN